MRRLIGLVGMLFFGAATVFGQSAGAVRAQELYSTTGHVKVDNSINTAVVPVTYAASTTFNGANGDHFEETLTGDVTAVTLTSFVSGTNYSFKICQDATGNRAFTAPSTFAGWNAISTAASTCTTQTGYYDGTNINFPAAGKSTTTSATTTNALISGCGVFYTGSGLTYTIQACNYQLGGIVYTSPQVNRTLAAADPTNPRIDVFYVDNTGTANVLTGTAASSPSEPSIDPTSQISLGFVTVNAGETTPAGVVTADVYKENAGTPTEWNCTVSGTDFNCADTTQPYAGTKDIRSVGADVTDYVKLANTSTVAATTYNILAFEMYTATAWSGQNEVWVTLYNGTGAVGNTVFSSSTTYGWNGKTAGAYQLVIIPISAFGLGSNSYDSMRILWNTGGKTATGKTIYIDNIQLQNNNVSGGATGSTGGVTSVAITGDNIIYNSSIVGSPITSTGTFDLSKSIKNVNAGYVLAGPIGSLGTNVGVRQFVHCTFHTAVNADVNKSFSCPAWSNSLIAGNMLLVIAPGQNNNTTASFSDSQGNTFTLKPTGGTNANQGTIATATVGVSNGDIITGSGIHWWDNGGSWSQYDFWVFELTGASAINLAYVNENTGGNIVQAISPGAATDALIRLSLTGSNNVGTPNAGSITMNPTGTSITTFTAADVNMGFGVADIFAPGSTASVTNTAAITCTSCTSSTQYILLADIAQSASAGAAPPVYRRLGEGDLPASAVSAIQSVNRFTLGAPVNLPSATSTTILSETITMPSDGCPCRVFEITHGIVNSTASGVWVSWVSDGTNDNAVVQSTTTDSHAPSLTGVDISTSYANSQSVTFTWKVNPGTYTGTPTMQIINTAATGTSAQGSGMTLIVLQSRN